ncbi:hypothetical protein LXL04_002533 [Taraxacum kok-saghyz]
MREEGIHISRIGMESEWRQVRGKRRQERKVTETSEETTYFVSNIPKEARKAEIINVFNKYGRATDVFMSNNMGKNGKYYVFVRFRDIQDTQELEKKLDGILFRGRKLEVNIAKHSRKPLPRPNIAFQYPKIPFKAPIHPPHIGAGNGFRNQRTYAEATHNDTRKETTFPASHSAPPPPPPPISSQKPITLWREAETYNWLRKTSLIGEASSLTHLGHLPKLLRTWNGARIEMAYLGGLRVLMEFGDSVAAREFKENKDRWMKYMTWVDDGEHVNIGSDRVAWIRIVGLPLNLWGQKNFAAITNGFGKTIAPFDEIQRRVDLSCAKIGILTERKSRINDEVYVEVEGRLTKIGIIEFDEEWFPFKFDPTENNFEDEFRRDVNVEDVIKTAKKTTENTQAIPIIEEPEEGEIREEDRYQSPTDLKMNEEVDDSVGIPDTPAANNQAMTEMVEEPAAGEKTRERRQEDKTWHASINYVGNPRTLEEKSPPRKVSAIMVDDNFNTPCRSREGGSKEKKVASPVQEQENLINGLPTGCFGPVSSTFHPRLMGSPRPPTMVSRSLGKRKRIVSGQNVRIPIISSMAPLSENTETLPSPSLTLVVENPIAIPLLVNPLVNPDQSDGRTTNQNSELPPNADSHEDESVRGNTNPSEAEITAKIGNDLGFQIEADNPILREVLGESGECNGL